jgi:hypothetical protein
MVPCLCGICGFPRTRNHSHRAPRLFLSGTCDDDAARLGHVLGFIDSPEARLAVFASHDTAIDGVCALLHVHDAFYQIRLWVAKQGIIVLDASSCASLDIHISDRSCAARYQWYCVCTARHDACARQAVRVADRVDQCGHRALGAV